ncbi:MAG: D-xylose transport system substrate-binding protein [Acidimicrobiaceae bacterium]|jgi:D-xylose transport system substrate-binding protein|nr:D-xylose transport system substrate-binding protein [Acidimicrobiaceae bacterium]MDQ1366632.1 D-xylose transport system substrate-binding protein [Acidimicrobiaceae bacterium]MDQ1370587.1 D-xylose transport system substrate-binding protein [Acidimicrobiaceae bacterium]MDQ1378495.1 D-xylose transport system substrate-binding protein [Acidimicrobiaceae bacterium]MDQ1400028.1 D-xylose transport system substrate-binding protein [Acidimicrobiaceae bacterium]
MHHSLQRAALVAVAATTVIGMVGCSSKSTTNTTATTAAGGTSTTAAASISASSFTADYSAMAQLKSIASQGKGLIGVLLPDTTTSARYESFDRPYLIKAFQAAGLSTTDLKIDNAQGSAATMQTQAEADITQGATVLLIDPIDSGSGAAIEANATAKGVKVVDYDRLVKGGASGRTYVSFDNVKVGQLIGQGEIDCIAAWNVAKPNVLVMDGDPTDNNALLFSQGYNGVLKAKFDDGSYVKVGEPAGTWTPSVAQTTFEQQFSAHPNINAVITPNDDNANAVIAALQKSSIPPKKFPTTGQDASLSGLQNILKGYQCGTVYKPINLEAQGAAAVALYLRAGKTPPSGLANGTTKDGSTDIQSVLLTPQWVTGQNMEATVIKDGAAKASDVCIAALASACTASGIS